MDSDQEELLFQLTIKFLQTKSWQEAELLIRKQPELLNQDIDRIITSMMNIQPNDVARSFVYVHRVVLKRCRQVGVEAAFRETEGVEKPDIGIFS